MIGCKRVVNRILHRCCLIRFLNCRIPNRQVLRDTHGKRGQLFHVTKNTRARCYGRACTGSSTGWLWYDIRVQFCQWLISHRQILNRFPILSSDEAQFKRDRMSNSWNSHLWSTDSPHGTVERAFQHQFVVIADQLVGLLMSEQHLTADN
jgi:hypothetical protein